MIAALTRAWYDRPPMPAICVSPAFPLIFAGGVVLTPEQRVSNMGAVWDASRGVVLSGSNFVTWADQVPTATADTMTAAAGNEPTYVADDAGWPCVNFTGAQRFEAAGSADIRSTAAFSMGAWVKIGVGGISTVLYGDDTTPQRFSLRTNTSNQLFAETNGGPTSVATPALTVGAWTHVAFVFDGSLAQALRGQIYYDGVAVTTTNTGMTTPLNVPTGLAHLGAYSGGGAPFSGRMADVCIGKTAWTPAEVTSLYSYHRRN